MINDRPFSRGGNVVQPTALRQVSITRPPQAARRKMIAEVRHAYMFELLWDGTVPLYDVARIDGVLDAVPPAGSDTFAAAD
jgi:hypothetical protein